MPKKSAKGPNRWVGSNWDRDNWVIQFQGFIECLQELDPTLSLEITEADPVFTGSWLTV